MLTSMEELEALYGQPHERSVLIVDIDAVYFHCSKALARSKLWDPDRYVERSRLPSAGDMLKRNFDETFDALAYDRDLAERMRTSLY